MLHCLWKSASCFHLSDWKSSEILHINFSEFGISITDDWPRSDIFYDRYGIGLDVTQWRARVTHWYCLNKYLPEYTCITFLFRWTNFRHVKRYLLQHHIIGLLLNNVGKRERHVFAMVGLVCTNFVCKLATFIRIKWSMGKAADLSSTVWFANN